MSYLLDRIRPLYFMLFDAAVFVIVPFLALLLRLDGDTSSAYFNILLKVVLIGVIIKLAVFSFYPYEVPMQEQNSCSNSVQR